MALKPGRRVTDGEDIGYFMNETAERGIVVVHTNATSGLGEALDDANAAVAIPGSTGGAPAGILMNDVVNLDLTRQHLNQHQDEVQINGKVTVLTNGWCVTNALPAGINPSGGQAAFHTTDGNLTNVESYVGDPNLRRPVGKFLSSRDADGYVKVQVNLP
tara:strand:+ start:22905 stop:23384 length:480 start_codon:yes stop_codon:yes gene_type:complete